MTCLNCDCWRMRLRSRPSLDLAGTAAIGPERSERCGFDRRTDCTKSGPTGLSELLEWITGTSIQSSDSVRAGHLEVLARITQARNTKPDRGEALLHAVLQSWWRVCLCLSPIR